MQWQRLSSVRNSTLSKRKPRCEALEDRQLLTVVVSEFLADNETGLIDRNGGHSDWIELRNTGNQPQDITGWYLTDDSADLAKWKFPSTTLAPNEHLVIFASGENIRQSGSELHTNFKLSKDGEYLALVQADGTTVASEFSPEFPSQMADVSYGVSADLASTGYFSIPTPGELNVVAPIADASQSIVINELMYNLPREGILDAENVEEEFIELHNRGPLDTDLTGWQFTRGVDFTFPNVSIPAGGYLVVAADVNAFQTKYPGVTNVVGGWTGQLANNGETIELINSSGVQVDSVRYASEGDWSTRAVGPVDRGHTGWIWTAGHDGNGHSMELINPAMSNNVGQNWTSSASLNGTPGVENSAKSTNVAPLISEVLHSPAIPQSNELVTVTARLTDEQPNASATLHWRIAGADNFEAVAMTAAGGGTVSGVIPPQADMAVVEFYVEATDAQAASRTWPAPTNEGAQVVNALYQVLDSFDQDAEWNPESTPIYFQVMTPTERNEFTGINRQSDAQFNTTFIAVNGTGIDVIYNAGVRIRGSASRSNAIPNNRLSIPNDRPWKGVTRVNINASNPENQVSGAALFRLAGIETADAHGVRMFSNGVDLKNGGYYAHVEVLDSDYAANHFPNDPDGTVYRGRRDDESPPGGQSAGLVYRGEDPLPYVSYVKNSNASQADWSDVINLTNVLNNAPDETYVQDVQAVADVEQWFRAFAMNSLLANDEYGLFTGDRRGDDYAMYVGVNDARFRMLPYDLDSMYTNANYPVNRPQNVPALNRLIEHAEFRQQYYGQFIDLADNILLSDEASEVIDNAIGSFANQAAIDGIKDFIRRRAANVKNQINLELTVTTNGDNNGIIPRLTDPSLVLSGSAPAAFTQSVTVNGLPVDTLAANRNWSIAAGSNTATETVSIFREGSEWKYLDDGSDQGNAWRESDFNDDAWKVGNGEFGYGDGDETTVIEGGPTNDRFQTSYFRRTFDIENADEITALQASIRYDDGIAVYINGVEVARENLPDDAAFDTFANGSKSNENQLVDFTLPIESLVSGTNTIAVEIHQHEPTSSDVSFDMILDSVKTVEINEQNATLLRMFPGLNRFEVIAFDGKDGSGNVLERETVDVWYDTPTQVISSITADTTWNADSGPYEISGSVTIPDGVTLTIEPGTTVFFRDNARLLINGRLDAIGTENAKIRFTRLPGSSGSWDGLQFRNSMNDSRIDHAIIEYGVTSDGMIGLEGSELTLNHVTLDNTDRRRIRSINSSLVVRDSVFENIFDPGQAPTSDNQSEHIWGRGIPNNGQWILERNVFGHITGHNDSVDFDAPRLPGPIPIIRENTFMGGGDDALDMTGDVWIEGNTFQNFIKDEFNVDPGESNTISSSAGTFWVIGNTLANVQHASLIKENAVMHFLSNTVVSSSFAPLYFDLPGQTSGPGRGAVVQNSIFNDVPFTFDHIQPDTDLTVTHSFLPAVDAEVGGVGNQFGDPHISSLADGAKLLPGSTAAGAGIDGQDMGSDVPLGAVIIGAPIGTTDSTSATLKVGGPAITHYQYRVNGGEFSTERAIDEAIQLSNLANGDYTVDVIGKNALGFVQSQPTSSETWTVDRNSPASVRINEVLASQSTIEIDGEYPDLIELFNPSAAPLDISGYSLTDDASISDKFIFPAGTVLSAHGYLSVVAGSVNVPVPQTGFGLSADGETLSLYDNSADRQLVDAVTFGLQLDNLSIGRMGDDAEWALTRPSFGGKNLPQPVNSGEHLVINEWYTDGDIRVKQDFVELHNPTNFPAAIGGHYLSDKPFAIPSKSQIAPLSFIAANGYRAFTADGDPQDGNDHVDFRLSPDLEQIGFFDPELNLLDFVFSYPQTSEVSQGRSPDAATEFQFMVPSPGSSNGDQQTDQVDLGFSWNAEWKYDRSGEDLGTAWRDLEYDDSQWDTGIGPLGNEQERLAYPIQTEFELTSRTYYFRRNFNVGSELDLSRITAEFETQVDDGFVVYLNGVEVVRQGMRDGEVAFDTFANRSVNEAQVEGPFNVPANLFKTGQNVFAVEVHQVSDASRDLVFGMSFQASVPVEQKSTAAELIDGLRISELMFDNSADGPLDFVEVQNISDVPLNVEGVRLTGVDFTFPAVTIAPGDYAVVTENVDAFVRHYGQSLKVVGEFSGELSNTGEEIAILLPAPHDAAILRFDYEDDWQVSAAGNGKSLEVQDTSVSYKRWGDASIWQASENQHGSPGHATQRNPIASIVINEVLSHTDFPQVDTIELFNTSSTVMDIGGWYLSDSALTPMKFKIPSGTLVAPGGYLTFDENDFNASLGADPNDFALSSSQGETLWLWQANDDQLIEVIDSARFGASANGETIGRIPNASGIMYPLADNSLGFANGAARVGPVVISELNYHPADPTAAALAIDSTLNDDDLEFVELYNSSAQTVDLTNWRIREGIDFDFKAGTMLPAGGVIVVVSFDPSTNPSKLAAFKTQYGIVDSVRIVGGYSGKLDNGDDSVTLQRPDEPPAEKPSFIPRLLEDQVAYDDNAPWPSSADGSGDSLTRTIPAKFGNDASSWTAAAPSPGIVVGASIPGDLNGDLVVDVQDIDLMCSVVRSNNGIPRFDLNGDGVVSDLDMFFLVEDILGTSVGDVNLDGIFNSTDLVLIFRVGEYEDGIAGNSGWADGDWNCDGDFSSRDLVTAFQRGKYSQAATGLDDVDNAFDFAAARENAAEGSQTKKATKQLHTRIVAVEQVFDEFI
ncbi:MAG: lamin tail domain-containing protein [Planctomycetales bacterium]|nr:lamin tail domain-containing protein [Planctomycetales bacterium]